MKLIIKYQKRDIFLQKKDKRLLMTHQINHLNLEQTNWVEISDESRGAYNVNSQIRFKTTMLKSSLCHYSDPYVLVKGTITISAAGDDAAARQADERDKGVTFKNCAPFINCISEINNTQVGNSKDIDIVMPMCNLIEYNDNYAKKNRKLMAIF